MTGSARHPDRALRDERKGEGRLDEYDEAWLAWWNEKHGSAPEEQVGAFHLGSEREGGTFSERLQGVKEGEVSSWWARDLGEAWDSIGEREDVPFGRVGGQYGLIYRDRAHSFVGAAESMKSWAALVVVAEFVATGQGVLYIDCESGVSTFAERLSLSGLNRENAVEYIAYVRPEEPLFLRGNDVRKDAVLQDFIYTGWAVQAKLLVIDGVTEFMSTQGWDINSATDVAKYHGSLLRRWPGGITTLEIDHVAKAFGEGNGPSALGSQHKRAGVDGAAYHFTHRLKGGVGGRSESDIEVLKDREGQIRGALEPGSDAAATFVLDDTGESMKISFEVPVDRHTAREEKKDRRNQVLREQILELLEHENLGSKAIAQRLGVSQTRVQAQTVVLMNDELIMRETEKPSAPGVRVDS